MRSFFRKKSVFVLILAVAALLSLNWSGRPDGFFEVRNTSFLERKWPQAGKNAGAAHIRELNTADKGSVDKIYRNIQEREYWISLNKETGKYQSPNRRHNIRSYYVPGQWQMQSRIDSAGYNWKLALATEGIYADGKRTAVPAADPAAIIQQGRIDFEHPSFTEQYLNTPEGVRQNFIVKEAPKSTGALAVKLGISGMKASQIRGDDGILFSDGKNLLTYTGLKAWDADGRPLSARMELSEDKKNLFLVAQVENAAYPVTIDPIITNRRSDARMEGNQLDSHFGQRVSGVGDVNGDGYGDVIVGANTYDNGENDEGAAFVYHGSANGIDSVAAVMLEGNQQQCMFGWAVSGAGDINGDGYSDVIVGAHGYSLDQSNEGQAFIYYGSASGISATADLTLEGNQEGASFGMGVSSAGDVNGDGYGDVVVGAYGYDGDQLGEGAALIYHGSANGLDTTAKTIVGSNQRGGGMGNSVSGAGDVNGDGYSDIIVGAFLFSNGHSAEGGAFIYHGSATGIDTTVKVLLECNQTNAYFGHSVSGAGDVNGDGYADVIVGAYAYHDGLVNEGAAFVYYGSANTVNATPAAVIQGEQAYAQMGSSVSGAGDIDGDGYADVVVGTGNYIQPTDKPAFVYHGSANGLIITARDSLKIDQAVNGCDVSGAGDINGDGISDLIVGAGEYYGDLPREGAAFVFYGSTGSVSTTAATTLENDQDSSSFGLSMSGAGDINSDGYADLVIGAPHYDHGETDEGAAFIYYGSADGIGDNYDVMLEANQSNALFGIDAAGAGDINGDGYGDLLVGASQYNISKGATFVYYGSAEGIDIARRTNIEFDLGPTRFGSKVSGAGDVNGDGYADIIVGGPGFPVRPEFVDMIEGAVFIYHGTATGISTTYAIRMESDRLGEGVGSAISAAGDINGDGYSDVIIGVPGHDNTPGNFLYPEGGAFVYYGSTGGLNRTDMDTLKGFQSSSLLGISVSGAGDVNGDGYSDVILGAKNHNNGQQQEGAAFVYHGSATGINPTASSVLESNNVTSRFGESVSRAGDINGDGYADVIVGASEYHNPETKEGGAFIYHGSMDGVRTVASVVLEGNQMNARFATGVSAAGDLNGDGYGDLIVGTYHRENREGTVNVYYGNNGGGFERNLRLFNTSTTDPINNDNISDNSFGIGLFARNPDGRSKAKLVWETRGPGQSFSHSSPISNSTEFTAEQSAFSDLGIGGLLLTDDVSKTGFGTKVRVRIKYDQATALNGQLYGPWIYPLDIYNSQGSAPLPVELVGFEAIAVQNTLVKLEWKTVSEVNNEYFTVERSSDGRRWQELHRIKGAGNSSQLLSYQTFDYKPYQGVSYYRLLQTDTDKKSKYSQIRAVKIGSDQDQSVVYPNPATDQVTLRNNPSELSDIELIGHDGRRVNSFVRIRNGGDRSIIIELKRLPKGLYILKTKTAIHRISKQ